MAAGPKSYRVLARQSVFDDLRAIEAFIARTHPLNAARYIEKILDAIDTLAILPELHPLAPSLSGLQVRQLLVGSHRVLFRIEDDGRTVDVLRVVHQRERVEKYARWMIENRAF